MSAPPRVMLVTTSLMLGGAETQVFLIARELSARGHPVHMVTMRPAEAYEDELGALGVPLSSLGMRRGRADPRALLRLARIVRAWRPDVVHSHMVHANLLARLTRLLAPMPVLVSTAHNLDEGARWRELAYRFTDPLSNLTTNVCAAAVKRFVAVGAVPRGRIERVPNGLDLRRFGRDPTTRARVRAALGVPSADRFLFLAVGRLEPQKDYPTMLRALAQLVDTGRTPLTLIVGTGPDEATLRTEAATLGLDVDHLRFLGPRSDVPELLSAVDAYVMSSAWEGLPMVLLEAAASGLPIVATDVGGNAEIVENGVTGTLVAAGDPKALAAAMAATIDAQPAQRVAWGDAGRARIEREFELGAVVECWQALYTRLLDRRAGDTLETRDT